MKSAIVSAGPKVEIHNIPIPTPGAGEVLVKVVYSGCNPKDWKVFDLMPGTKPSNQGNDFAGFIEALGEGVTEFHVGDRVGAFSTFAAGGSYVEYAVAPALTTFSLPQKTSFQDLLSPYYKAAAIPLAALTAVVGLYASDRLNLPQPTAPATEPITIVIYGGSSAVGTYAIQFAKHSNIHPIIAVAGKAQDHVRSMLDSSKGDAIVDYRNGDKAVVQDIRNALQGRKLLHAYDATAGSNSFVNLSKVVEHEEIPNSIKQSQSGVFHVHDAQAELGYVYSRYIARGLAEGWFKPQKQVECPGGLEDVEDALKKLKDGSSSATKFVFKISDTPGIISSDG